MSIFDSFLGIMASHRCLGCGREGRVLCLSCMQELRPSTSRCYRCQQLVQDSYTCVRCLEESPLARVQAAAAYDGYARDMLWKLKAGSAQAAAREMARTMQACIEVYAPTNDLPPLLVPVPTAASRARARGYDQAVLLARQLSRLLHLPYKDCLVRRGQAHQVGATRHQRLQQVQNTFWVKPWAHLDNRPIILVDDVLTTGATLEAAAKIISLAGASSVEAMVFAQA